MSAGTRLDISEDNKSLTISSTGAEELTWADQLANAGLPNTARLTVDHLISESTLDASSYYAVQRMRI